MKGRVFEEESQEPRIFVYVPCLLIDSRHIALGAYSNSWIHTQHGWLVNVVGVKDHMNVVVVNY